MPNPKKIDTIYRIQDAGYLREFDAALHFNLPRLAIEMNPFHSLVFDYQGGMGVILDLRITSDRIVCIEDFGDLELMGKSCNVDWLASEESHVYKFCRGPEYPRDMVLNHRRGEHGTVKPGQPSEGVLLGRSAMPIPCQYSHGFKLPLTLTLLHGFDTPCTTELFVPVDEDMCSKVRRPIKSSLYAPRVGNKPEPVNGMEKKGKESLGPPRGCAVRAGLYEPKRFSRHTSPPPSSGTSRLPLTPAVLISHRSSQKQA